MTGIDAIASFLGGLGLFFTGIRSLSANMLQIGGRRCATPSPVM